MTQRRAKRKRQRTQRAIAQGDEPPDPASALALALGGAAWTGIGYGAKKLFGKKSKAPTIPSYKSPLAGEDTKLKPGDKVNLINTSPQGVLSPPNTGRQTILGG